MKCGAYDYVGDNGRESITDRKVLWALFAKVKV